MVETTMQFGLPGFRFHPTEEELLDFYLKNTIFGNKLHCDVIGFLNIYRHDPWELPGRAKIGEREWYFFVPIDRKHGNTGRSNRTTSHGFWKATGNDRKIFSLSDPKRMLGHRKTLVFYNGRAPNGSKTDWVMNEYRLLDSIPSPKEIVLCKIYRKATSLKALEERAAMEDKMKTIDNHGSPSTTPPLSMTNSLDMSDNFLFYYQQQEDQVAPLTPTNELVLKREVEEVMLLKDETSKNEKSLRNSLQLPSGNQELELQVPICNMDWSQDSFWLNSPWLQNFISFVSPTF